jgi:molybdenum cofactor cytidylyltransferase
VAAIVLAAGSASRMGQLKQLLPYGRRTLVAHSVQQAIDAGFGPVVVVVGAESAAVRAAVAAQPVEIAQNERWQLGMGSSVAVGIQQLQEVTPNSAAVAILVADQPFVTADHLQNMRRLLYTDSAPIVAAEYNGTLGVPALFRRELFGTLASLPADAGARHVLRDSGFAVTPFPLPDAAMDIDTPEDLVALRVELKSLSSTS